LERWFFDEGKRKRLLKMDTLLTDLVPLTWDIDDAMDEAEEQIY
jgi:hypothetical protein